MLAMDPPVPPKNSSAWVCAPPFLARGGIFQNPLTIGGEPVSKIHQWWFRAPDELVIRHVAALCPLGETDEYRGGRADDTVRRSARSCTDMAPCDAHAVRLLEQALLGSPPL